MEVEELLVSVDARAESYKLLSDCYYLPDEPLIERLGNIDACAGWPCSEIARLAPQVSDLKALIVDFSRLFIGPFKLLAPAYGSVYLEEQHTVMGNSTIDAEKRYLQEGLKISRKEIPDHIAIELEFMHFLAFKQNQSIRSSDPEATSVYLKKQKSFLKDHLGLWLPGFNDRVRKASKTLFYKELAKVTQLFVEQDLKNLSK